MARLFIAVWPPDEVVEQLMSLHRKDQRGIRFVRPENWHITLRFLGDADPDEVADALEGLEFEPTSVRLGPAVDVLADRALVLPAAGVDQLARQVIDRTRQIGQQSRKRFVGHLTIARAHANVPMPRVLGTLFNAEFDVTEVALVQSRLDPDGARYETIASWGSA